MKNIALLAALLLVSRIDLNRSLLSQAYGLTNSAPIQDLAFQSDVFISSEAVDKDGSSVNGYCNATLVSNQVLITAAHCIAESLALSKNQLHIEVGAYKNVTRKSDGKSISVGYVPFLKMDVAAHFIVSKSLQKEILSRGTNANITPSEDVGIIILNEKLDLDPNFIFAQIVPQKLWLEVKSHLANAQLSIVSINYFDTMSMDYKRTAPLNKTSISFGGWLESQSLSRVEEGDSGSPVFVQINGHHYVVAVVKGLASNIFANWDVLSILSTKACEIAHENKLDLEGTNLFCR